MFLMLNFNRNKNVWPLNTNIYLQLYEEELAALPLEKINILNDLRRLQAVIYVKGGNKRY